MVSRSIQLKIGLEFEVGLQSFEVSGLSECLLHKLIIYVF